MEIINYHTLADEVYGYLRDAIIKNRLKSGERINDKDIAGHFKSSTTPVREAVKRLSAEGFIEIIPNRSAFVRECSFEKFFEVSETMIVLDSYACKQALRNLTDDDIRELADLTLEMEKFQTRETLEEYLGINAKIHVHIWKTIKNDFFSSLIFRVFDDMLQRHRQILYSEWTLHSPFLRKSMKIHKKFLEILQTRNETRLNAVIRQHWSIFSKPI
jgi:DNA-binding GntR family transcriptional regulator